LLAGEKREASPHRDSGREQPAEDHVRAQMKMPVPVDVCRRTSVKPFEFRQLLSNEHLERAMKKRMIKDLRVPVQVEERGNPRLVMLEVLWAATVGEGLVEIEMQSGVDRRRRGKSRGAG